MKQIYVISREFDNGTSQVLFACDGDWNYLRNKIYRLMDQVGARDFDQIRRDGEYYFVLYTANEEIWLRIDEPEFYKQ